MQVDTMDPSLSNSTPMDLLSATEDSSPCNPFMVFTYLYQGQKADWSAVQDILTALSALNHYTSRPATPQFEEMTLLHFVQHYSVPKNVSEEPVARKKMVVVRVQPHCSPDTCGPQYEQYCQQS